MERLKADRNPRPAFNLSMSSVRKCHVTYFIAEVALSIDDQFIQLPDGLHAIGDIGIRCAWKSTIWAIWNLWIITMK